MNMVLSNLFYDTPIYDTYSSPHPSHQICVISCNRSMRHFQWIVARSSEHPKLTGPNVQCLIHDVSNSETYCYIMIFLVFPIFYFTTACRTSTNPSGLMNYDNLLDKMSSDLSGDFGKTIIISQYGGNGVQVRSSQLVQEEE